MSSWQLVFTLNEESKANSLKELNGLLASLHFSVRFHEASV